MPDIYGMRRANGDWFAFDDRGAFRVPVYHSSHQGMLARAHHAEMLLFSPVVLDKRALQELEPPKDARAYFWLLDDTVDNPTRGRRLNHKQLALLAL
jgi:hypothetical protein